LDGAVRDAQRFRSSVPEPERAGDQSAAGTDHRRDRDTFRLSARTRTARHARVRANRRTDFQIIAGGSMMPGAQSHSGLARAVRACAPPLAVFVLFLLGWQGAVVLFKISSYELPSPMAVWGAAHENWRALLIATGLTAAGALCGFIISCVLGTL